MYSLIIFMRPKILPEEGSINRCLFNFLVDAILENCENMLEISFNWY